MSCCWKKFISESILRKSTNFQLLQKHLSGYPAIRPNGHEFCQVFFILKFIEVNTIKIHGGGEAFPRYYFLCNECIIKLFISVFNNFTCIHRTNVKDYAFILRFSLERFLSLGYQIIRRQVPQQEVQTLSFHIVYVVIMGERQAPLC